MAIGGSSCVRIARTSSIEFEPPTLDFGQLQFAREAAMFVLNTKSTEEAFQIFTQGLEPVTSVANGSKIAMDDSEEEDECNGVFGNQLFPTKTSQRCRDVATAPF